MSSHRRKTMYFGRAYGPRKALLRGLMTSLVEHGRIKTTVDKAKEVRRHIEKAITVGKKGDVATRRLLLSRVPNVEVVNKIVDDLSKRFAERPGGYTRVIKIGRRPGDTAEMAFLEFVDYDYEAKTAKVPKKEEKAQKKEESKARKLVARAHSKHKKSVARMQKASRAYNRA